MRVRTFLLGYVFTFLVGPLALGGENGHDHYRVARRYMDEAKHSTDLLRLAYLGWMIGDELEEAVHLDPDLLDARLDLVRYCVMAPRVVGGSIRMAREQVAEIAKRDRALGAFASGYVAYRVHELGPARGKFQEAIREARSITTRVLALTWLGWLSQETQQYDVAFTAFDQILVLDASHAEALYEIGRTAVFAGRDLDRGETALKKYLTTKPAGDMPTLADAHWQLGLLLRKRGDADGARRELDAALQIDPNHPGAKSALR